MPFSMLSYAIDGDGFSLDWHLFSWNEDEASELISNHQFAKMNVEVNILDVMKWSFTHLIENKDDSSPYSRG